MKVTRALAALASGVVLVGCSASTEPDDRAATRPSSPGSEVVGSTEPPVRSKATAEEVVADPRSTLDQYEIGPHGAATVWRLCPNGHCLRPKYAVAVSRDGFRTRTVLDLPVQRYVRVRSAPGGRLIVMGHERNIWLVDRHGAVRPIRWLKRPAPVGADEVPLEWGNLFGVDLGAARMHPVRTINGISQFWQHGRELRGVDTDNEGHAGYVSSRDGGRTWTRKPIPGRYALWMPIPESGPPAVIRGGDGATLFPFDAAFRLDPGSRQWVRVSGTGTPKAYVSCAHVTAEGRLLLCVDDWSSRRKESGFWLSTDGSWSDFEYVAPGAPFADDKVFQPVVVGVRRPRDGDLTLVVTDPGTGRVYATHDEGRHFRELRAR